MDWSKGFSSIYYLTIVDKTTWKDVSRIEITGGSIKRTLDEIRDSADIDCVQYDLSTEQLIRVWLDAKQEGSSSHTPLFTGLATSPSRSINGKLETHSLQCYSVLKIAQDILLPRGWYAPKETDTGYLLKTLLRDTRAPIIFPEDVDTPKLTTSIIAEDGENKLSMADKILNAMGAWDMNLTGNGEIVISPINKDPVAIFGALTNDVVEPSLNVEYDWYSCPNVYRAVADNLYSVARDDSPDSPFSTITRGREIWEEDTNCYLNENETLAEYARRKLKEAQRVSTEISYTRRFDPGISVGDVVRLNYPEQEIFGDYVITSQTIDLGYGAKTSEEVMAI